MFFFINPAKTDSQPDEKTYQMMPDEAIRLRILANSDSEKDQQLKYLIRDEVSSEIHSWVEDMTNIEDARHLIADRIHRIEQIAEEVVQEEGEHNDIHVKYDENVMFPEKTYGPYVYPEGEYEAVLITIGEGDGSNWWCVLFPPLCFVDFDDSKTDDDVDHEEDKEGAEDDEKENVSVKFMLFEWLGLS